MQCAKPCQTFHNHFKGKSCLYKKELIHTIACLSNSITSYGERGTYIFFTQGAFSPDA